MSSRFCDYAKAVSFFGTVPFRTVREAYNIGVYCGHRIPAAERALMRRDTTGKWLCLYARDVAKCRIPKFESRMADMDELDVYYLLAYATEFCGESRLLRELEQRLLEYPDVAELYISVCVRQRVPDLELAGVGGDLKL